MSFSKTFADLLNGEFEDFAGLAFLPFTIIVIVSLLFLIYPSTWIYENKISILCYYFATVFVVNLIVYHFKNKTTLIGGFIFISIMLLPLIVLVSTTVECLVESLPYQGTSMWQATNFNGAFLQKSDFSQSTLGNTDFKFSLLENTCFYQAKYLNIKLFRKTRLASRKLLINSIKTKVNRKLSR